MLGFSPTAGSPLASFQYVPAEVAAVAKVGGKPKPHGYFGDRLDASSRIQDKYEAIEKAAHQDQEQGRTKKKLIAHDDKARRNAHVARIKIKAGVTSYLIAEREALQDAKAKVKADAIAKAEVIAKAVADAATQRAIDFPPLPIPHAGEAKAKRDQSIKHQKAEDDQIMALMAMMLMED